MLPLKVRKCVAPPNHLRSESHLAHLQHSKTLDKYENKKLFEVHV